MLHFEALTISLGKGKEVVSSNFEEKTDYVYVKQEIVK